MSQAAEVLILDDWYQNTSELRDKLDFWFESSCMNQFFLKLLSKTMLEIRKTWSPDWLTSPATGVIEVPMCLIDKLWQWH